MENKILEEAEMRLDLKRTAWTVGGVKTNRKNSVSAN